MSGRNRVPSFQLASGTTNERDNSYNLTTIGNIFYNTDTSNVEVYHEDPSNNAGWRDLVMNNKEQIDISGNLGVSGDVDISGNVTTTKIVARTASGVSLVNNAGDKGLKVYDNGNVGINLESDVTSPKAPMTIDESNSNNDQTATSATFKYIKHNGAGVASENTGEMAIYANGRIVATNAVGSHAGTFTASDMRIKSDVRDLSNGEAIEKLKQLKPKRYGYVDKVKRGNTEVYGFIAQEVAEVLPESIMKEMDYMPTIYKVFDLSGTTINCNDSSNNSLYDVSNVELDDKLLLYDENDKKHFVKVSGVAMSLNTIQIDKTINGSKVFAYGKEEDDFHFIKKDHIWTLTTASVLEMLEKIESLEARLTALETH